MRTAKYFLSLGLLGLILAGCSATLTNLTPRQMVRSPTGLYPFEVKWDTTQETPVGGTIKAYVVVGMEAYPMQPVAMVRNRWETVVPIPGDQNKIDYNYKFEFIRKGPPQGRADSLFSPPYQLVIVNQ
jgi:hypothetical protein